MPPRRAVALAQALTMILLLAPGPVPGGPSPALGAIAPAEPVPTLVLDATGKGIGCQAGAGRFKAPKLPKDPPWPPGTRPQATPEPTPDPSAGSPAPDASAAPDATTEETADAPTMLLAGHGIRVAQLSAAEPSEEPAEPPADEEAAAAAQEPTADELAEPAAEPTPLANEDDVDLEPDVDTSRETRRQGKRSGLISGIDVSHHNGDIDYARVREAGNRFVFIKATQDNVFIDPMFPTNLANAQAEGLAAGAYHFFDYNLDGTIQADHFLDRVEAFGGLEGNLPPVVDVECWPPIGSSVHVLSEARLRDFVERVYERSGRLPIVYTSVFMWKQVVGNAGGFEHLPMWAACWGCEPPPSLAPGWDEWAFWQTGVGRIPGVGRLDANFFSGSEEDLDDLRLRPLALDSGAPATNREVVDIDLGGRDATHARTSRDGETWSGWSRIRSMPTVSLDPEEGEQLVFVQLRMGPDLTSGVFSDSIIVDRTPPELEGPSIGLAHAPLGGSTVDDALPEAPEGRAPDAVPVTISWTARDALAGLADASLSSTCGAVSVQREVPGSAAPEERSPWAATTWLEPGLACDVTVVSRDAAGNSTAGTIDAVQATIVPLDGTDVPGGRVDGSQVGVIAQRGPDAGRALVTLDGEPAGEVDLFAPVTGGPEVVFVADLEPGEHRVAVEVTGARHPQSTGTRVQVEGFVALGVAEEASETSAPSPRPSEPVEQPSPSAG